MTRTAKKQSTSKLSALAAKVLANPKSGRDAKRLAGSVLTQDETPGQAGRVKRKPMLTNVTAIAMALAWHGSRPEQYMLQEDWDGLPAKERFRWRAEARAFLRALKRPR
jgi:hypothetical protein